MGKDIAKIKTNLDRDQEFHLDPSQKRSYERSWPGCKQSGSHSLKALCKESSQCVDN